MKGFEKQTHDQQEGSFGRLWLAGFFFFSSILLVGADDSTHQYTFGEEVKFWMSKVGPFQNPQEIYSYHHLPFCKSPGELKYRSDSLGAALEGNELVDSNFHVKFKEIRKAQKICDLIMTKDVAHKFKLAVANHYWYQMYIDELPIWGMVGDYHAEKDAAQEVGKHFLYTHTDFSLSYNGNQIIEVNLTTSNPIEIAEGKTFPMTYSVTWVPTTKSFLHRFDRYLDFDFFEHKIHWVSIFNSFMMVVFLCGLVALILVRALKKDFIRFRDEQDDDLDLEGALDESGWKQVHGDVFRPPPFLHMLSALLGAGCQLVLFSFCLIALTFIGSAYHERGLVTKIAIGCYCVTSFTAGYVSAKTYKSGGGKNWKIVMPLTASLLPGITLSVVIFLNLLAFYYQTIHRIGISTLVSVISIWLFLVCPLVVLGTIVGRSVAVVADYPCRVNRFKRPIPGYKWRPIYLAMMGGILPFGSIFIEMHFIFSSFWNYKFYYVYGFMLLVFLILIVVNICAAVVCTYFLLNHEDWRWHWTSFASGGSTAFYVFLYAVYYFFSKTHMTGMLQVSYYFGYMVIFCSIFFLLCGAIAYMGSSFFVHRIYRVLKSD